MESHSRLKKAALGLFAFLVYSMGIKTVWGAQFQTHVMVHVIKLPVVAHWTTPQFLSYLVIWSGDWMAVFGAVVAIGFALADRSTKAVLNHTLVLWMGRASYSLYLVHATVLFTLMYLLIGTKYVYLLAPLYFLLTIVVTAVFYRWVEIPTMNLGKSLARRMLQTKPVTAQPEPTVAN
jgi:peptidoglycan/LPS O-acetylase OafA/YrhL